MGFNIYSTDQFCFILSLFRTQAGMALQIFFSFICELTCLNILMFSFCHLHNWEFRAALLLDRPLHKARGYVLPGKEKCYWSLSQEDWCSNRLCQNSLKTIQFYDRFQLSRHGLFNLVYDLKSPLFQRRF